MSSKLIARNSFDRRYFWLERLIAVFALVNLTLVLFDLSYLTLRSLYLQATPALVQLYDRIRPLMAANYYREVNRFGFAIDYFWSIDLPFILVLTIDILLRVRAIHQRHPELSWLEAALRRWYDLFLLVPVWRWLRVIPVFIRLYKVDLVNLDLLRIDLAETLF